MLHIDILHFYGGSVYIFVVLLIVNRFVGCKAHLIIFMNTCAIQEIKLLLLLLFLLLLLLLFLLLLLLLLLYKQCLSYFLIIIPITSKQCTSTTLNSVVKNGTVTKALPLILVISNLNWIQGHPTRI